MSAKNNKNSRNNRSRHNKNSRNNRSRHNIILVAASIYVITKLSSCYIAEISTSSISKINVE